MAIKVSFYNNISEPIVVDKKIILIKQKTIDFKDDVNIQQPSIILNEDIKCNYAYIPNFNRYYYVTISKLTGHRYQYSFKVDVLKTYAQQIKNTTCTVLRNEKLSNAYLHDSEYKTLSYKKYVTKSFPKGLTEDCIILNTIGG